MRIELQTGELLRRILEGRSAGVPPFSMAVSARYGRASTGALGRNDISRLKAAQGSHWSAPVDGRFDHQYMQAYARSVSSTTRSNWSRDAYIGGYNLCSAS